MATLAEKIYKINRPDSYYDSDAEAYEFMLMWYGVDAGFYEWLFFDSIIKEKVTGSVVSANSENINKVFEVAENTRVLSAENLSKNEFSVIKQIIRAKNCFRLFKDGTIERVAIVTSSSEERVSDNLYSFTITIKEQNSKIYK